MHMYLNLYFDTAKVCAEMSNNVTQHGQFGSEDNS